MNTMIGPKEVVGYLNELLELDHECVRKLFSVRAECNEKIGDHPTAQVRAYDGPLTLGVMGLINGMFPTYDDGFGMIIYDSDDEGLPIKFKLSRGE